MTIWQFIKARSAKRAAAAADAKRKEHPLDADMPLRLHIDGKVEITPLLPQEGLSASFPIGPSLIDGYSKFNLNGKTCFRVLLAHEETGTASYLLIVQDETEYLARWFVQLDEVTPQSPDEWDFWLSDKDGSIGLAAFQSKTGTIYNRLWVPGSPGRIEPIGHKEFILLDRFDGGQSKTVQHQSMLYGRRVEDEASPCDELILLSTSVERDGSCVSIDVGVDLDAKADLKVIY